jgi:GTPase SAR1 family protein
VSNLSSLENVESKWIPEVREHCPETPIVLVAMKCDLWDDEEKKSQLEEEGFQFITSEQANQIKEAIGAVAYRETSAKQHRGIEPIFNLCAQIVLDPESLGITKESLQNNNQQQDNNNQQQETSNNNTKEERKCILM